MVPLDDVLTLDRYEEAVDLTRTYDTAGVRSFGRGLFKRPAQHGADVSYSKLYRLRRDQIVMSRLFAWEGALALVTHEFDGLYVSPEFPTFSVDDTRAIPRYIGHFVSWSGLADLLAGSTRGLGQRRKRVHADELLQVEIPLPSLSEQQRIASRLDAIRAVHERVQQLVADRSKFSNALFSALALRSDIDQRSKALAGWNQLPLADVLVESEDKVTVQADETYRVAGIYSFGKGLIDRGSIKGSQTSYKSLIRLSAGDVVVSKLNGWEGAVAVVDDQFAGAHVSSEYPTFHPKPDRLTPEFFRGIARSPSFWRALDANTRGSMVRRRRINPRHFLATGAWVPPIETQRQMARQLERLTVADRVAALMEAEAGALVPSALNEVFAEVS